jgi:serine protease Do
MNKKNTQTQCIEFPLRNRGRRISDNFSFSKLASTFAFGVVVTLSVLSSAHAASFDDLLKSVTNALPSNPFDVEGSAFNKLVDSEEYDKAQSYFLDKYASYFDKRFNVDKKEVTSQLQKLGRWSLEKNYRAAVGVVITRLQSVSDLSSNTDESWKNAAESIAEAMKTALEINSSDLLRTSKVGDDSTDVISRELGRVYDIVKRDRQKALGSTFDEVIQSGRVGGVYPRDPFTVDDYRRSAEFQTKVIATLNQSTPETLSEVSSRLQEVTASDTTRRLTRASDLKQRLDRLGKGPYPLDKLADLRSLVKEFGAESGLQSAVKIGFIDLTATSFKDRNVFDFELSFDKDYGFAFEDANEAFLAKNSTAGYDYIFVTDLSAAKILREFKNKREIPSKVQSGTRQEHNPEYVGAMSEYQRAMTKMQAAKLESASNNSRPCYGSPIACALGGIVNGLSSSSAEKEFKKSSDSLASTPQTVSKPVYSKYSYQLVDINASKIARVDYYVIDVNKKKIYSNYFEIKDSEKFTVSYNVEEDDPDGSSILRNNRREEDVTAWEKRSIPVKLSALFDPANIGQNQPKPFTTVEAFLKPLSTRQYANASPTYVNKSTTKTEVKDSVTRGESGAIADERFDSILIIKTPKAIGTGFYVTPDLILTAFHVVDGSSLVQITFYDGTKSYGKVVDSDVRLDLAIIKAQTIGKPLKMYSGPIRLGETAEAIGHPKGYEFTITRGVVSAIRKQPSALLKAGPPIEFVQTDTPISPGNSGGPLFIKDAVIGVNDWVRVDKASQNLNFSVSYNEIREYLNRFEGKIK